VVTKIILCMPHLNKPTLSPPVADCVTLIRHDKYLIFGITLSNTGYGLDSPGVESRWGQDFPHLSRPTVRPTQPPVEWVPVLPRR